MKQTNLLLGSFVVISFFWLAEAQAQATDVDCDRCVDTSDIAIGAIRPALIENEAVNTPKLKDGAVTIRKLRDGAVSNSKLRDGAVTAAKIGASAVGVTQVDPGQVQLRVGGSCAVGSFIIASAEDGSVTRESGSDDDYNTRYGDDSLTINTPGVGRVNTAIGVGALQLNTDGFWNTAIGVDALGRNATGTRNTATGVNALWFNTTGSFNTATGTNTLLFNTTGESNTATGVGALFDNTTGGGNTATGRLALHYNTVGTDNVATGLSALLENVTGSFNTAIGNMSLSNNLEGTRNTAIGYNAGQNTTGSYNILIDHSGVDAESNTIRIGNANHFRAFVFGIRGQTTGINDAATVVIDSNQQLGTINSSARYKEDIQDMGEASDKLLQLRPVTFRYKEPYENGEKPLDYGLIAEEVAEVFPDLVIYNEEGQPQTVKYRLLSTLLLNELQKEHRVNVDQTAMLNDQAVEMAELKAQTAEVQELRAQIAELTLLVTQLAKSGALSQETLVASTGAD